MPNLLNLASQAFLLLELVTLVALLVWSITWTIKLRQDMRNG
ncbi:MAG: hypothetical protein Q7K13_01480 [Polynucleobacter sp.]|nr:hypothetical protein [Polynucleobacter sp.]MDO8713142.1 hypothetical protein [Polynucleobacter sp.]